MCLFLRFFLSYPVRILEIVFVLTISSLNYLTILNCEKAISMQHLEIVIVWNPYFVTGATLFNTGPLIHPVNKQYHTRLRSTGPKNEFQEASKQVRPESELRS